MADDIGAIRVEMRSARLRDDSGRWLAAAHEGAHDAAEALADELRDLVQMQILGMGLIRTGELLSSVHSYMLSAYEGAAVAEADHAQPLEQGAVAHDIPNAFGWGITVHHPGNRAYGFFEKAVGVLNPRVPEIVRRYMPS